MIVELESCVWKSNSKMRTERETNSSSQEFFQPHDSNPSVIFFFLPDILNFQLARNNIRINNRTAGSLLQERTITFVKQESYLSKMLRMTLEDGYAIH